MIRLLTVLIAAAVASGAHAAPTPALVDAMAAADVVLIGEAHDDAAAHRFELETLQALAARGRRVVLAMEMFERDQQPFLAAYVAGRIVETHLFQRIKPWPNYASDYRPLVEFAKARGWPVVGTNVPRPLAARVSREGLGALARLPRAERRQAAREVRCPHDAYRARFVALMAEAGGHGGPKMDVERLYRAQCLKDETMAESLAALVAPGATVVHINGAFHSDDRLGITPRIQRRLPGAKVLVVTLTPGGGDAVALPPPG